MIAGHDRRPRSPVTIAGLSAVRKEMAVRLARAFNTTPQFWLNLQSGRTASITTEAGPTGVDDYAGSYKFIFRQPPPWIPTSPAGIVPAPKVSTVYVYGRLHTDP